jgi:hypothetical protein
MAKSFIFLIFCFSLWANAATNEDLNFVANNNEDHLSAGLVPNAANETATPTRKPTAKPTAPKPTQKPTRKFHPH